MKKRILSISPALALCLLLLPTAAFAEEGTPISNTTSELNSGCYYVPDGEVEVLPDVIWSTGGVFDLANTIRVTATSTLDLNGKTLSAKECDADGKGKTILVIESGATLTLTDSSATEDSSGTGCISGANAAKSATNAAIVVENGGKLVMESGTISGFGGLNDNGNVGGVYVKSGGTFEMKGGTIKNCANYSGRSAGGVYVENGAKFTMSGGTISSCAGSMAGGVYVADGGKFEMSGGTITGGTSGTAGGVYVAGGAEFTMSSGKIENCENTTMAETVGSGFSTTSATTLYVAPGGKFTLSGDARINKGSTTVGNIMDLCLAGELDANGGTVNGTVQLSGDISSSSSSATVFANRVNATGNISAGTYNGYVTVNGNGELSGGTYNGNVTVTGEISGGTYNGNVEINGDISGWDTLFTESSTVTTKSADGQINAATFRGTVDNTAGATVVGGDFAGAKLTNIATVRFLHPGDKVYTTLWRYNWPIVIGEIPDPKADGYLFNGWFYQADGSEKKLEFDQVGETASFFITQDLELYTDWTPITYTVKLDDGGDEYDNFPETTEYPATYDNTITLPTMTMEGRQFVGWQDGDGHVYSGSVKNLTTVNGATVVLWPKWTGHTVELAYNCNGGTHEEGTFFFEHATAGGTMTYPSAATRAGYQFKGWTPQLTEIPDSNTTFTAQWEANTYTVSFDANGGEGTMADQSFTYDKTQALTANSFTNGDCGFLGWAKTADGTVEYTDGASVSNLTAELNGNVTLYARWTTEVVQVSNNRGNKKTFPNIKIAHDEAGAGDCIMLLASVRSEDLTAVRDNLTVDLAGHILTTNLTFTGDNQTLCNGTLNGTVTETGSGFSLDQMTVTGLVTLGGSGTLRPGTILQGGIKTTAAGKTLKDYLASGTAYEQNGSIVSGNVTELTGTVKVVEHTNHTYGTDGKCACGAEYRYTNRTDSSSSSTSATVTVPVSSDHATVEVKAKISQGNATVEVSDQQIEKVIADGAGAVTIDVSGLKNVERITVPSHVVEKTNEAENADLAVTLPTGSVALDEAALESVAVASKGKAVTVSVVSVPVSALSASVKEIIGTEVSVVAVVDINITVGGKKQTSFDGGKVTISVPYTPKKGEDTGTLTVWFIKDDGTIENKGGWYDAENKCFVFETDHLSQYLLVNTNKAVGFADVPESAYFHDAVLWAADKGITGGVTATTFAPYASCTRAQIVTFLWRAAGCPAPQSVNRFTDVPDTAYYAQAVAWAVENDITTGVTDTTFQPDAPCTRAQAVAFLFRYAASQGMDAVTLQELVSSYSDADQVPGYAASAFNWALANGIVQGNDGVLMPNGTCTRAQIVTFLYRLLGE